jgi:type IV conjugative transfer system protein TraE
MNIKKYMDIRSRLFQENAILKFGILMFATATMVMAVAFIFALGHSRTIYVPAAYASKSFEVTDRSISENGIRMFTRYTFDLFLNYTPASAKEKFSEMVPLIHTRYFDEVNAELGRQLDTIERLKIVSSYQIEEIKINEIERTIRVKGIRTRSTYGKKVDEEVEQWQIGYQVVDANFKVKRIEKVG